MSVKKCTCTECGAEISLSNIKSHMRRHEVHPETFQDIPDSLDCCFCGKTCKNRNSLSQHQLRCKLNPERIPIANNLSTYSELGHIPWNKGLTKHTDERLLKQSELFTSRYRAGMYDFSSRKNPMSDPVHRKTLSESMKQVYSKNPPKVSGRSKQGWYKQFYCRSSWELAYVLYMEAQNVSIEPCNRSFEYVYDSDVHSYFPDFYLPESDTYVEIKGYEDSKAIAKKEQFQHKLEVLYESDIQPILDFVIGKYGKDFINLYQKNGPVTQR